MKVRFHSAGVKRLGQKRVEVAEGQVVDVEWGDMERHDPSTYQIVAENVVAGPPETRAPEKPGPEPESAPSGESDAVAPAAPAGKRGR